MRLLPGAKMMSLSASGREWLGEKRNLTLSTGKERPLRRQRRRLELQLASNKVRGRVSTGKGDGKRRKMGKRMKMRKDVTMKKTRKLMGPRQR